MASANSAFYDLQKTDRARTSLQATPNTSEGEVHWARIPVSFAGTESAADTVNLCQLPPGCVPIPSLSSITASGDPGTTLTVDIGTADNDDGWCDGANLGALSAAGNVNCLAPAIPAFELTRTEMGADSGADDGLTTVIATWRTVGTNSAVTITFNLAYKLPR